MGRKRMYMVRVTTCRTAGGGKFRFFASNREISAHSESQVVAILDETARGLGESIYEVQFLYDF